MKNQNCKYYPCHKGMEDCTFCYCILYPCGIPLKNGKGGLWIKTLIGKKVWDCSECVWVHKKENLEEICRHSSVGRAGVL